MKNLLCLFLILAGIVNLAEYKEGFGIDTSKLFNKYVTNKRIKTGDKLQKRLLLVYGLLCFLMAGVIFFYQF